MSLYTAYDGVAAFHQHTYPRRRPARYDDFRQVARPAPAPVGHALDLPYQEFINGDFLLNDAQLTA